MTWHVGTVHSVLDETATARSLMLDVPGWPGHFAGQHVDVRLTAADGYSATRSYSIASAPGDDRLQLTVERLDDGEVSPYLTGVIGEGDRLELRGPVGGWFVWRPTQAEPVYLVAGGSGIVPLMAMVRAHARTASDARLGLLYGARAPDAVIYREELRARQQDGLRVTFAYSRVAPEGSSRPPGRIDAAQLDQTGWPPDAGATTYVCGPTGFVERVADLMVAAGHDPARIRTERFGPTGGRP